MLCLCAAGTNYAQSCDTTFLAPDSIQLLADNAIDAFQKNGDTMFIAGSFHAVGKPTGSFIGVDKTNGKPVHQPLWPKVAGTVNFALRDGNGGWIIGGKFNRVGDSLRKNLAWISSAEAVTAWNPGANDEVSCGVRVDSILYLGGMFSQVNNVSRTRLAAVKLDDNASLLPLNVPVDNKINTMAIAGDNLWIGGYFNTVAGQTRHKLAAINLLTSLPISQVSNLDSGFLDHVVTIVIADGNLFAGGRFQRQGAYCV
ncbi:MAG: hypothetical protein EOP49_50075 [Sphingobacteriales bacterium]|nr:MAG: hypothetical protein EOP49_50075 [Sphingobacteriales bacterium]